MFPLNHYELEMRGRQIVEERLAEVEGRRLLKEARAAASAGERARMIGEITLAARLRSALASTLRALAARVDEPQPAALGARTSRRLLSA